MKRLLASIPLRRGCFFETSGELSVHARSSSSPTVFRHWPRSREFLYFAAEGSLRTEVVIHSWSLEALTPGFSLLLRPPRPRICTNPHCNSTHEQRFFL